MDLRDVSYYVKKKQGFPSVTDTGIADIYLGGSGFSFKMKLSTADTKDRQNFFKVDKVDVDVKNFNIKLQKSNHKLLFGLAKPLMLKVIRPALQKALEKVIKDKVHELDTLLYQVKQEVDRTEQHIKENPQDAPNVYSRYAKATRKQILQGKKKAKDVAADKKVNMAVTKEDSIFPKIHLPGGISSKATEYKELARKGDKWESPVFKLGSASTSKDIPTAPKVTRKPHDVTQGGVRGSQNVGNTGSLTDRAANFEGERSHEGTHGYTGGQDFSGSQGYGASATQTHGGNTGIGGYTNGNSTGFGQQVDKAFSPNHGQTNGGITNGGVTNGGVTNGKHNTQLGSENPVLTGRY